MRGSDGRRPLLTGLSAFVLTPANGDGVVDTEALSRLVDRVAGSGAASLGVLGSTGTFMYLGRAQRQRAVAAAAEAAAGRLPVIAGVGALRTQDAAEFARDAEAARADAVLLAPVSYTPLSQDEVFGHVVSVAGACGLPVCLYNNPATTHFTFGQPLLARLAGVTRVGGVKMPLPQDGDVAGELAALRRVAGTSFKVGYSGDTGLAAAMLAGADGFYSVLAGILPRETCALYEAAEAGDDARAGALNARLEPLWALFRAQGGMRVAYEIARALGVCDAAPPLPVRGLDSAGQAAVRAALEGLGGSAGQLGGGDVAASGHMIE